MSPRETLYQLIDQLPEEDLSTAKRILQALSETTAPPQVSLDEAPLDDEPAEDDFDGGLKEARADADGGRVVTHEEMKRRWGLR